jgi:IS5 family transposase
MKTDGHLGRCYLKGREGDAAANVILTAVGYNLRLFLTWLSSLLGFILLGLCRALTVTPALKWTVRGVSLKREEQLDGAALAIIAMYQATVGAIKTAAMSPAASAIISSRSAASLRKP